MARAARRRVDRQARHAASCRSPTSRSARPATTATTASSSTCAARSASSTSELGGLAHAGHPVLTIDAQRPGGPRADLLLRRVRHRGRGLVARASTRSTSPTCRRPRTTRSRSSTRARAERSPTAPTRRSARCSTAPRRRPTSRSWRYVAPSGERRRGGRRAARRDPRRDEGHDDLRLRPALPALDRPVPQGRARRPGASCSSSTTAATDAPVPGRAVLVRAAQARAGGRATSARSRATACPSGASGSTATRPQAIRALDAEVRLMQIGFVGLGRMGGNMVHRIHRDSDHQVVAFDFSEEARERGGGARRARRRRRSRSSSRSSRRRGPCGSWSRPATRRSRPSTALAELLDEGDTIVDGGNSKWTDDKRARGGSSRRAASTTSTSARAAACGASRSATA